MQELIAEIVAALKAEEIACAEVGAAALAMRQAEKRSHETADRIRELLARLHTALYQEAGLPEPSFGSPLASFPVARTGGALLTGQSHTTE